MIPSERSNSNYNSFYGWYALAGALLVMFITGGTFVSAFGVLFPVLCEVFQWSRTIVAGALSMGIITMGLLSPLSGFLVNKFGPRRMIVMGNVITALGFACIFLVQESWQFYLLYVLIGASCGLGGFIPCSSVANNWFIRKKSLAMGLLGACPGVSGFLFPPILTIMINNFGWQIAYLTIAVTVFIGSVIVGGILLIRNKPADLDQMPDGLQIEQYHRDNKPAPDRSNVHQDQSLLSSLREPKIWLIALIAAANGFMMGAITTHQVAYFRDIGFSAMTSAFTLSTVSALLILGSLAYGALALKLDIRYLAGISFILQFLAVLILLITRNLIPIFVYSILMGLGIGALTAAMPTFVSSYFKTELFAMKMGIILPFYVITQALAATAFGAIHDITASYTFGFSILIFVALAGLLGILLIRKPEPV